MSQALTRRRIPWFLLAIWAGVPGCTHNHYYNGVPGCPPAGQTVTTQVGPICEVPSGPATIASSGGVSPGVIVQTNPTNVLSSIPPNPQKIVISQPAYGGPSLSQSVSRLKWRRPDPESLATIRTEGGLADDGTIQR